MTPALIIAVAVGLALIVAGVRLNKKTKQTPPVVRSVSIEKKS
jgi:hypothetical protein